MPSTEAQFVIRRVVMLLSVLFLTLFSAPPAFAIEPPAIDPSALPPDGTGPDQPTELRRVCSAPTIFPGANFADKPWANDYLRLADAQKFATGAGVTVAVIDTGVNGSARVPALPGGDFVDKAGDGMNDCEWAGIVVPEAGRGRGHALRQLRELAERHGFPVRARRIFLEPALESA